MIHGVISQRLNKHPGLVGYDVVHKGNKSYGIDDYHLLFRGGTADINTPLASGVLQNIDRTYDTVYEDKIATKEQIEKLEESTKEEAKTLNELNGTFIKRIVKKDGQEYAILRDEHNTPEKELIVNRLLDLYVEGVMARKDVGMVITSKMRVGTLDIHTKDGSPERTLVEHTADGIKPVPLDKKINPKQIKASLFFLLKLHERLPEFQKHLNCTVKDGDYELKFIEGKPEFHKHGDAPSEFEMGICNDIIKLKW